jgi:ankyrin repeat protein
MKMVTNAILKALAIRIVLHKSLNRSLDNNFISRLIKNREWSSLIFVVNTRKDNFNELISNLDENGWSMLILCCENQAPLRIYKAMFKCRSQLFDKMDGNRRFPIHVVCGSGAKPDVIKYTIQNTSKLAILAQDIDGKTPLHLLCEHYLWKSCSVFQPIDTAWKENLMNIVHQLCEKDRRIINIEDYQGRTAIEIAIENDFPYEVVRCLQRISAGEWKSRRSFRIPEIDTKTGLFGLSKSDLERLEVGSITLIEQEQVPSASPARGIANKFRTLSLQENGNQNYLEESRLKKRKSFQATAA